MTANGLTFMVVGAARCGTTSVRHLLDAHPQVHAPTKETYVVTPEAARRAGLADRVLSLEEHVRVYAGAAPPETRAMGEVSSCYLHLHREAIPRIRELFGDLGIVILLRDPVERAFSHYLYFARDGREPRTFARAIDEELQGQVAPEDFGRHFLGMGLYVDQVEAYLSAFSRVRIWLFDELREDWSGFVSDLCGFLGVEPSRAPRRVAHLNAGGLPRFSRLQRSVFRPSSARSRLRAKLASVIGEQRTARLVEGLRRKGLRRATLDDEVRGRLVERCREEIRRLESVLGRDLSSWRR